MKFLTRKLIRPEDLNANNTLFGGQLLRWIDEEAGIYAMTKLNTKRVVTKFISEINFVSSAVQGDVVEIGLDFIDIGRTSLTFGCVVRNIFSKKNIITIDKIVFVKVDEHGQSVAHGLTKADIVTTATT
jgi:acyl-CoA hydrolase